MPFELKYTLLCQSPIMHFQANREEQFGAALRATEVKPKLDKFLARKVGDSISPSWYINGKDGALNYKMHIVRKEPKKPPKDHDVHPIFYSNMGDKNKFKYPILYGYELIIICYIQDLLETIDSNIDEFFIITNFGSMQNKGFGSYIIKDEKNKWDNKEKMPDDSIIAAYLKNHTGSNECYMISKDYKKSKNEAIQLNPDSESAKNHVSYYALDDIQRLYPLIKEGFIYTCCKNQNGYSQVQRIKVECLDNEVQRIEVPLYFKIINGKVYFIAKKIHEDLLNKEYVFSTRTENRNTYKYTPSEDDIRSNFGLEENEETDSIMGKYLSVLFKGTERENISKIENISIIKL